MPSTREHLIYMAGQILRNFGPRGETAAVAAAAEHLKLFWDRRMKAEAVAMLDDPDVELSGGVRSVFEKLRR
ncbi:MAG TPA: formate dehydrogenase subunit delta [Novosphingobium sp.]|nr:formate dehydrogenase subunit delta [Novosphingobium sp.]